MAALVTVSTGLYLIAFGVVLLTIGLLLASNRWGAGENFAERLGSSEFTVRVVGILMCLIGIGFVGKGITYAVH